MTESFRTWLFEQSERTDVIGDLARSIRDDDLFPEHGNRAIYEGYFGEPAEAAEHFERAWVEYEDAYRS